MDTIAKPVDFQSQLCALMDTFEQTGRAAESLTLSEADFRRLAEEGIGRIQRRDNAPRFGEPYGLEKSRETRIEQERRSMEHFIVGNCEYSFNGVRIVLDNRVLEPTFLGKTT